MRKWMWLALLLAGAAAVRFARLDAEPLWGDELVTAVLGLGLRVRELPFEQCLDRQSLEAALQLDTSATFQTISQAVREDSTHPPTFTYLANRWLALTWDGDWHRFRWWARLLPALLGVGWVAAMGWLGSVVAPGSAWRGARMTLALAAVSPLAVHLSQQFRYYTLVMVVLALATIGHLLVVRAVAAGRRPGVGPLLLWACASSAGFYVQYLAGMVFICQVVVLLGVAWRRRQLHQFLVARLVIALLVPLAAWIPWSLVAMDHAGQPGSAWIARSLSVRHAVEDVGASVAGGLVHFAGLPTRRGVEPGLVFGVLVLLVAMTWVAYRLWRDRPMARATADTRDAAIWCLAQTGLVMAGLLVGGWLTRRGLVLTVRYSLLYAAPLIAAAGAWAGAFSGWRRISVVAVLLGAATAGSAMAVTGTLAAPNHDPVRTARLVRDTSGDAVLLAWRVSQMTEAADGLALALAVFDTSPAARLALVAVRDGQAPETATSAALAACGRSTLWSNRDLRAVQARLPHCDAGAVTRYKVDSRSLFVLACRP